MTTNLVMTMVVLTINRNVCMEDLMVHNHVTIGDLVRRQGRRGRQGRGGRAEHGRRRYDPDLGDGDREVRDVVHGGVGVHQPAAVVLGGVAPRVAPARKGHACT